MKIKLMSLPHSTLVIGGGEFWSLIKIKFVLLSQSTYGSEGVANVDLHEDKVDIITSPINILFCYVTILSLGER